MANAPHEAATLRRAARMTPLFHGSCPTHEQYGMTCQDYNDLRADSNGCCNLCGDTHGWMNIDHDHELGGGAVRGLLCPRCNAGHMRRIDWGERAIDDRTREYLISPWYLRRHDLCLSYDPRVQVAPTDLNSADQTELVRLCRLSVGTSHYAARKAQPAFTHPGIAACLRARDLRPVMRLVWMVDRGLFDTDIAAPYGPRPRWVHAAITVPCSAVLNSCNASKGARV
jgi:hypothetical protein